MQLDLNLDFGIAEQLPTDENQGLFRVQDESEAENIRVKSFAFIHQVDPFAHPEDNLAGFCDFFDCDFSISNYYFLINLSDRFSG